MEEQEITEAAMLQWQLWCAYYMEEMFERADILEVEDGIEPLKQDDEVVKTVNSMFEWNQYPPNWYLYYFCFEEMKEACGNWNQIPEMDREAFSYSVLHGLKEKVNEIKITNE